MLAKEPDQVIRRKEERHKHCHSGERCRHDRPPYLPGALYHRRCRRNTGCPEPVNVLKHYHGSIQQHPHRQGDPHQREAINGDSGTEEEVEGCKNRDRDGKGHHHHQPYLPEEHPEHKHRQEPTNQCQVNNLIDVVLHQLRTVLLDDHLHALLLKFPVQLFNPFPHSVREVDDVRLCIVHHLHRYSIHAVDPADRFRLLFAVVNLCNVPDLNPVPSLSNHEVLDLTDILVFGVQVNEKAQSLFPDDSAILPPLHIS